ncbi:hypothetical protein K2173_018187 [Erythroxylum novogranatense]|uniref:Sugar phosphate transporter domain-containing protein n=1 Tax=Erythroxylum novogranatense TaxID=1862640 RepID=A0AAV8TNH9_9ROSI|nr:hypothetical protein K2173_018187 [Erythroxylum novogranatense]
MFTVHLDQLTLHHQNILNRSISLESQTYTDKLPKYLSVSDIGSYFWEEKDSSLGQILTPRPEMVEAQTWTTRRMSNPRLDPTTAVADDQAIDIPATPTGDVRNNAYSLLGSHFSPNILTALIIGSCYVAINFLEIVPLQYISSKKQFLKIFALSAIFCFSVVCGNTSLRYLPVSFNQAIGATTPFFTAIFAFLITCKKESAEVYCALLPVVCGIVLASNSEPLFHLFGFLVCVGSTAGRALKSVVQGILLTSEAERLHSMNLLHYMAPMAALILLPFTLFLEGNVAVITLQKAKVDPFIVFLLIGNATAAYLVNLTNFLVTKHTSALTLQVLGNAKAAVAAGVSVLIFRNPVTVMGMTGFVVTIMGVVLYSEAKKRSKLTTH